VKFLPASDAERREMLAAIGVPSIEALFASVPEAVRQEPDLTAPLSDLVIALRRISDRIDDEQDKLEAKMLADRAEGIAGLAEQLVSMTGPASGNSIPSGSSRFLRNTPSPCRG